MGQYEKIMGQEVTPHYDPCLTLLYFMLSHMSWTLTVYYYTHGAGLLFYMRTTLCVIILVCTYIMFCHFYNNFYQSHNCPFMY